MASTTVQFAQSTEGAQVPAAGEQPPASGAPAAGHEAGAAPAAGHEAAPAAGEHATGEAGAHTEVPHEEGHGAFPPFDSATFPSQILWLAITFGLLYLLMSKLALPRVGAILNERKHRIYSDLAEVDRLKDESEAAAAAYEQELAEARAKAGGIGQKARDAAKADADAKRAKAESAMADKLAQAEAAIGAAKAKAMKEVGGIALSTAEAIVSALTGGAVSKADVEKAVEAELAK